MEQRFVIPDFLPEEQLTALRQIIERLRGEGFLHYLQVLTQRGVTNEGNPLFTLHIDVGNNTGHITDVGPMGPSLHVPYYER